MPPKCGWPPPERIQRRGADRLLDTTRGRQADAGAGHLEQLGPPEMILERRNGQHLPIRHRNTCQRQPGQPYRLTTHPGITGSHRLLGTQQHIAHRIAFRSRESD